MPNSFVHPGMREGRPFSHDPGKEYEILKTVKNTAIKNSSENNEEPHKPHTDKIIRSLNLTLSLPVTS